MSLLQNTMAKSGTANFYNGVATQSVRLDDGSSAYFAFTPDSASSAVDRRKVTHSFWVKRGNVTTNQTLYSANENGADDYYLFRINDNNKILIVLDVNDSNFGYETSAVFRDTSAWYNVVLIIDTTQGTDTNRVKLYVNGVLQAITTKYSGGHVSQNFSTYVMDGAEDEIGRFAYNDTTPFDGYMSEVITTIGQNNTIDEFGELKNGVWIPINYAGSFGTNGFRLKFDQVGVGTASTSTIGADTSGNTNHWTSSGIVASDCAMPDSPENNFATFSSLVPTNTGTLSEGNLKSNSVVGGSGGKRGPISNFYATTGKWFCEGVTTSAGAPYWGPALYKNNNSTLFYTHIPTLYTNKFYLEGSVVQSVSFSNSAITSFAVDLDNQTTDVYVGGSKIGITVDWSGIDTFEGVFTGIQHGHSSSLSTSNCTVNYGQDGTFAGTQTAGGNADENGYGNFSMAVPSGYLACCSANIPEPTIGANSSSQADDYFETVLYEGDGSTQDIAVNFKPDWTWIKNRDATDDHQLFDSSRGATEVLESNTTTAEVTNDDTLTAFISTGFSLGDDVAVNTNNESYVSWNWLANGGTTVTNEAGSIDSTVQANTDAGFSIVTYTGTGSNATVGHGLSKPPSLIHVKERNNLDNWMFYNETIGNTKYMHLNSTIAAGVYNVWNNTSPTSSVFSLSTFASVNNNTDTYVAYCFHSVEGYSKIGSYTGNGSADGTFVYTGFAVKYFMIKRTDAVNNWTIFDSARKPQNDATRTVLFAESSVVEVDDAYPIDFLSNGFKIRNSGTGANASNGTYIYMAFGDSTKYANAR